MVVLIAGLNFLGYVLVKVLGSEHGFVVTGILGGLVSSTAVTLSFSQRSRREPAMSSAFVLAIVVAWTIMFVRVVVMVGLVNRALAGGLALALGCMAVAGLLVSLVLWRRSRARETGVVTAGANPFELSEAIKFGLLFGIVTVVAKAAEVYLGATDSTWRAPSPVSPMWMRFPSRWRISRPAIRKVSRSRSVHNRHCSDFEYPGEDRNGGVYGRACAAPHDHSGHPVAIRRRRRRDSSRMS